MSIESRQESERAVSRVISAAISRHGSSKMLETYLGDIEYLMRDQQWGEAVPLALALPHICAALADPGLRSSRAQFLEWCEAWVRPAQSDTCLSVPTPEALYALARGCAGADDLDARGGVPVQALRQLRLRRLSRAAPPRRKISPEEMSERADEPAPEREACAALLEAVRGWYSDSASMDATVQNNLARLAVLR
jgi:hypothetical protein